MADFGTAVLWECFTADDIRLDDNVDKTLSWKPGTLREAVEITAKVSSKSVRPFIGSFPVSFSVTCIMDVPTG
jgi:hypothetical protein